MDTTEHCNEVLHYADDIAVLLHIELVRAIIGRRKFSRNDVQNIQTTQMKLERREREQKRGINSTLGSSYNNKNNKTKKCG